MTATNDDWNSMPSGDSPVCLRRDLQLVTIRRGLSVAHVIKDPVNLKYYEFDEHEMALLRRLNDGVSWSELCDWFNRRFPPLRLSHQSLQSMVWRLYQQGLLTTFASGQGRKIAGRARQQSRREWIQRLSQPWVIRLPGLNPGPWLSPVNWLFGWIFSPIFVGLASIGLIVILALIFAQHESIARMGADTVEIFSRQNVFLFASAIIVTKVFHELGHAAAAHRMGSECHEMGLILLAGLPSLYCDVSDAWILPNRWHRIAISLAGIWVEILIAALSFVVWVNSVPGIVHAVSFNLMVVCSVGTLLFNANPLVRYDGYYVLMDLTGVSNLGQKSHESLVRVLMGWVLGTPDLRRMDSAEVPMWCLAYGLLAACYRVFLTCAILWGLHMALKPVSMTFVVWLLASVALTSWGIKMVRNGSFQVRRSLAVGTSPWRVLVGVTFTAFVVVSGALMPFPWYVFGEAVMEPADRQTLVTAVPGELIERRDSGAIVEPGEIIARFENHDIDQEIQQMQSELGTQKQHLQALLSRRNQDLRAAEQIPGAEATVAALNHRLAHLLDESRRLEIRARQRSVIYPAPLRIEKPEVGELAGWTGSPLDSANRHAWLNVGDTICQIGSIDHLEAIAILAQDDLEAVAVGQRADIYLKSSGITVPGEIARISSLELDSKDETTVGASLPPGPGPHGRGKTHGKWYQVQIRCLTPVPRGTVVRSRSKIRIHAGSRTFGQWFALQFYKTFRWHA